MLDLQAVYVRDVAELTDIGISSMVRIEDVDVSAISDVRLNGVSTKFFAFDETTLLAALPESFTSYQELEDANNPGFIAKSISDIQITRTYTGTDGLEYTQGEIIKWEDETLDTTAPYGSKRVTLDSSVLRLYGHQFDKVVRVLVNKKAQPFVIESAGTVLTAIPEGSGNIESVDVITTASQVNKLTFFEYLLGEELHTVTGLFKMVQQFVKVLMTTPGTDMFNKRLGGNMQNWVGQKINPSVPQSLVAQTILQVLQVGGQIQVQQILANVPVEERLSDVQVLNAALDPIDPTMMEMSIKLNTFSGRTAFFSMLIGDLKEDITAVTQGYSSGTL